MRSKFAVCGVVVVMTLVFLLLLGVAPCEARVKREIKPGGDTQCPAPFQVVHERSTCITQGTCFFTFFGTCTIRGDNCTGVTECGDS